MVRFSRVPSWAYPNYGHRLPEHYYKHVMQLKEPATRVHDQPKQTDHLDLKYNEEKKRVERVSDVPIEVLYPKEADQGLWGGEGVVRGYIKPRKYFQAGLPRPKTWVPYLKKAVFYSEILDKYFSIVCTQRTLALVDDHRGFDNYILRTPPNDLKSQLALLLRREMLLTLTKKDFKNQDHEKEMLKKYGDVIIPLEEAEWFGLSPKDAIKRHKLLSAKENVKIPLKFELTQRLLNDLKDKKNQPLGTKTLGLMDKVKSTFGFNTK